MFFRRYSEGINTLRLGYDFYADIAERIVENRKKAGLTQEQLAKKLVFPKKGFVGMSKLKPEFGWTIWISYPKCWT